MTEKNKFTTEKEWTVKELSDDFEFPFRERKIRQLVKTGVLKAKYYGPQKVVILHSQVVKFLKMYKETKQKNENR